ncbi:MAG: hypothetical protein WCK09_09485 [Bacteroidota bacterium]
MKTAIPLEICVFVLQNRLVKPFKTYLMMKSICPGKLHYNKSELAQKLNISGKTLEKHLGQLIKLNWIGWDPKSKMVFIRGFDKIREMYQFNSRLAIICTQADFKTLTAFLFGAVVSNILRAKKRQLWQPDAAKKRYAKQSGCQPLFYPVANGYTAKILNYSLKGSMKLKNQAECGGYIVTKEQFEKTGVLYSNINYFKTKNPNYYLCKRSGLEIGLQLPDLISSKMDFSRRKKSATFIKRLKGN